MQSRILMLATSAFILACGATTATAQQGPMMQQPQMSQQEQPHHPGMGMMRRGGMMEPSGMHSGMMMRMLFAMMDSDGDGTVSLQEFQTAHERIFRAMDANKDGKLTLEEIQGFMRGAGTGAPRQ